jgi:[acyl-carrier-protein] S-malonyltransferase
MQPAITALTDILDDVPFARAQIPVIPNVTADPTRDPSLLKDLLIEQVISPVRWTESMQRLIAEGISEAFEVGPSNVLKGLMRRIDRNISVHEAGTLEAIEQL